MRAVAALVAGRDREDVAALFKVSLEAVDNWWAKWPAGGREALVVQPRGRRVGGHQLLSEAEQQVIRQTVPDHRPCDLGLAGQLWTRAGVRDLITKLYQVRLTEQGASKSLSRWGLSFQPRRTGHHRPQRSLPMHSRARDPAQPAAETRRFFHRRQRQPHIIRGYFGGPHVRYILE
ncbi:transposase [Streptomyces sp. V4I23]|uniref:winged helix-turn-helix domain-containing protein n=1 Tax=Streptomyces sp. V4I23 TaxID=3042282 RepID=UPI0027835245|nr:winged helix-turn-helix domain-containing protein [Streptomyces sp. V4I23]MDQ1006963.1 transposase [Streptomyces sp. V4I23]